MVSKPPLRPPIHKYHYQRLAIMKTCTAHNNIPAQQYRSTAHMHILTRQSSSDRVPQSHLYTLWPDLPISTAHIHTPIACSPYHFACNSLLHIQNTIYGPVLWCVSDWWWIWTGKMPVMTVHFCRYMSIIGCLDQGHITGKLSQLKAT